MKGFVTVRYRARAPQDVPREAFKLACDRTDHLGAVAMRLPLSDLLANAWLQGVADAGQVMGRHFMTTDPAIGLIP